MATLLVAAASDAVTVTVTEKCTHEDALTSGNARRKNAPTAPQVPVASAAVVVAAASDVAVADALSPEPADALTPATAALISSVVASSTRRFCVKMQPSWSFASSHELPFAVGSPIWPGANVPDMRASVGSPPTDAICFASSRTIALLVAAAFGDAGSWCCETAAISGLAAVSVHATLASPTLSVLRSSARCREEVTHMHNAERPFLHFIVSRYVTIAIHNTAITECAMTHIDITGG